MKDRMLTEYANALASRGLLVESYCPEPVYIQALSHDSRCMRKGALFVCKGEHFLPAYLDVALDQNAVAYVSEKKYRTDVPHLIVRDVRAAMPVLARLFYGDLTERITSVGITGTKGKTTVALFLRSILSAAYPNQAAIVSSVLTEDGHISVHPLNTTPEIFTLYDHYASAISTGYRFMVLETSSQALKYGRTAGLHFEVACFTNFDIDHISPIEHPSVEDYFNSKLSILRACRVACINRDMARYEEVETAARNAGAEVVTYGFHPQAHIRATDVRYSGEGYEFTVHAEGSIVPCFIPMHGEFNVSNALSAISIALSLGISWEHICFGLSHTAMHGRMELYRSGDDKVLILTDYAHNKMSFEALFSAVRREFPGRFVVTVFGAPGGKALNRRRELGELAALYSDHVVVTEDDSGDEPFEKIAYEICAALSGNNANYTVVRDRKEAISFAARLAASTSPAIVLLLGKGEEATQRIGSRLMEYPSDLTLAKREIETYDKQCQRESLPT